MWTAYSNTCVSNRSYHKTIRSTPKPSEEDDYCQPLTTSAASIPAHFWSFSGYTGCFRTESAFYPESAVFSLHLTLSLQVIPGLRSAVCVSHWPLKTAEIARNYNAHTRCEYVLLILRLKCSYFEIVTVVNRPYFVSHSIPYNVS